MPWRVTLPLVQCHQVRGRAESGGLRNPLASPATSFCACVDAKDVRRARTAMTVAVTRCWVRAVIRMVAPAAATGLANHTLVGLGDCALTCFGRPTMAPSSNGGARHGTDTRDDGRSVL